MKKVLCQLLVFLCAALCLSGCGSGAGNGAEPLMIQSFVIGSSEGKIETIREDGETHYIIHITLPENTDFKRCIANIELTQGASVDMSSPCIVDDLGGRPVLNLTLSERDLVVICDEQSQTYSFQIELE